MLSVDDIQVHDVSDGGIIRTSTSIHGRLETELPTTLLWDMSFDWSASDKSITTCTADVRDSAGTVVSAIEFGVGVADVSVSGGAQTVSLPRFRVTVTGTYTVRLYVEDRCVWTELVLVG